VTVTFGGNQIIFWLQRTQSVSRASCFETEKPRYEVGLD